MEKRFLIVDDDEIYNFICKEIVKRSGYACHIEEFTNSYEALQYLKNIDRMPDVILIDINIPFLDGWTFIEKLRDHENFDSKKSKIFVQSSSIYEKDIERANQHDLISGFIIKPLSMEQLSIIFSK